MKYIDVLVKEGYSPSHIMDVIEHKDISTLTQVINHIVMTNEEKARAYDEAMNKIKPLYEQAKKDGNPIWSTYEYLIPQLAESEDERMMREFNDWLCEEIECRTNDLRDEKDRRTLNMLCYILTKVKDWLEKQKEQHFTKRNAIFDKCVENCDPATMKKVSEEVDEMLQKEQKQAEWSDEDGETLACAISVFEDFAECKNVSVPPASAKRYLKRLKSLRPSWKPSEDEERLINTSISFLKDFADKGYENAVECIDWLKSKLNGNSC